MRVVLAILVSICVTPSSGWAALDVETSKLVDAFKKSYGWSRHVSMQMIVEGTWDTRAREVRRDETIINNDRFERYSHSYHVTFHDSKTQELIRERESDFLYLAKRGLAVEVVENPSQKRVLPPFVATNDKAKEWADLEAADPLRQSLFFGTLPLFSHKSLPDLLSSAESIRVSDDEYNGVPCKVLVTETPEGIISVWVAPTLGYTLQRCCLTKEAGKHLMPSGNVLDLALEYGEGQKKTVRGATVDIKLEDVTQEGGVFVPLTYSYKETCDMGDAQVETARARFSITSLDLKPDFDAGKAFEIPIDAGANILCWAGDGSYISGFVWKNGRIEPKVDSKAMDAVSETVASIKTEKHVESYRSTPPVRGEGVQRVPRRSYLFLFGIAALCLAAAVSLRLVFRRSSR